MQAIDLRDCDVYSYKSDGELDPLSEFPLMPRLLTEQLVLSETCHMKMATIHARTISCMEMQMGQWCTF